MSVFKRRKPDDAPIATEPEAEPLAGPVAGPVVADTGLGVPPFRPVVPAAPVAPATSRESFVMGRSPFSAPSPAMPAGPGASAGPGPQRGPSLPAAPVPAPRPMVAREAAERRTLVVGRGISLQGVVQEAERLVVEGTVEATMIHATELAISPGGMFKGEVEVEEAEVAGTIDGTLTARGNLVVRATGRVLGTARCRRLQVEDGGQITGRIEMLTEGAARQAGPEPAPTREAAE